MHGNNTVTDTLVTLRTSSHDSVSAMSPELVLQDSHSTVGHLDALGLQVHESPRDLLVPRLADISYNARIEYRRAKGFYEEPADVLRRHKRREDL